MASSHMTAMMARPNVVRFWNHAPPTAPRIPPVAAKPKTRPMVLEDACISRCRSTMIMMFAPANARLTPPVMKAIKRSSGCRNNHDSPSVTWLLMLVVSAAERSPWNSVRIRTREIIDAAYDIASTRKGKVRRTANSRPAIGGPISADSA